MTANFGGAPDGAGADDSIESLLGAYALDAVSDDERLQVDMLLGRSPSARAELETMQVAVDALAAEAASAPPIGTWDRLRDRLASADSDDEAGGAPPADALFPAGALSGQPQRRTAGPTEAPPARRPAAVEPSGGAAPGDRTDAAWPSDDSLDERGPAPIDEIGRRRAARADAAAGPGARVGRSRGWAFAAAAAAVVAVIMLGGLVVRQGTRIDNLSSEMASGGIERSAQQALADPSSELVDLTGGDLKVSVRAAVTEDGTGYLFAEDLPQLPAGQTYQLWAARDDNVVSVGVLGRRPTVSAFQTATDAKALAISVETAGGVVVSDHDPVAVGEFS